MLFNIFKRAGGSAQRAPAVAASAEPFADPEREYRRLRGLLASTPRYQRRDIRFLTYSISAVDCASFLAQFKEIFVDGLYNFEQSAGEPVIIDCGANIGMSALYFKSRFPKSTVIAIEADSEICALLRTNLDQNELSEVQVLNKAVWIHENGVSFAPDGADGGSIQGTSSKALVPSLRLKDLLSGYQAIDLLKIDIEGAEYQVLIDAESELPRVKNLFFEYHSWNGDEQRLDELLRLIRNAGFRYHITDIMPHHSPFINRGTGANMDLQLNIYAYRIA